MRVSSFWSLTPGVCIAALLSTSALSAGNTPASFSVMKEVKHDVSPLLRQIQPRLRPIGPHRVIPVRPIPLPQGTNLQEQDGARQFAAIGPLVSTTDPVNFAGVGQGDYGYNVGSAPPDTNGAVGATQYVQWVNSDFAVFNKTNGSLLMGPVAGNTLWAGFGGTCESHNDGDPIAQYDKLAGRWVMAQPVFSPPFSFCVAVSQTSDATGAWYRYQFTIQNPNTDFPDYPKLGVWPDGYYATFNIFQGNSFPGAALCALDRTKMLAGLAATDQCFQLNSSFGGVLPADFDGTVAPPLGSPNYLINFGKNSLNEWKFHVDWSNPANSTLTGPIKINVPKFSPACSGGICIPQKAAIQKLDSLADRLMYRLAYRNIGGHESLVATHSIASGNGRKSVSGIRWYELRTPATPTLFQSGTFAPSDSLHRWMGSIAMDKVGNIAVGYSLSGSSKYPSIAYTGRVPGDAAGTLQTEKITTTGGGSQTGGLERWGDYSAMSVDPIDDCTFYFTTEYLKTSGSFNWSTRINAFKFSTCS